MSNYKHWTKVRNMRMKPYEGLNHTEGKKRRETTWPAPQRSRQNWRCSIAIYFPVLVKKTNCQVWASDLMLCSILLEHTVALKREHLQRNNVSILSTGWCCRLFLHNVERWSEAEAGKALAMGLRRDNVRIMKPPSSTKHRQPRNRKYTSC